MYAKRLVFLDIETTGLHSATGDKIVEIGCIAYKGDEITTFNRLINPKRSIPSEVVKIHHITDKDVRDAPVFAEIAEEFLDFIKKDALCGHNALKFDIPFINYELRAAKMPIIRNKIIDTMDMYKKRFRDRKFPSLDHMCEKFDIDLEERKTNGHNAMVDVQLLIECYKKMKSIEELKPTYLIKI